VTWTGDPESWAYRLGVPPQHRDDFWRQREGSGKTSPRLVLDTTIDIAADRRDECADLSGIWLNHYTG